MSPPFELPRQVLGEEHPAHGVSHCLSSQRFPLFLRAGAEVWPGEADASSAAKKPADGAREDLLNHNEEDDIEDEIEDSAHY